MSQYNAPENLVLLSGGADSAAALAFYVETGRPTAALFVDYGQLAADDERAAARKVAHYFQAPLREATWTSQRTRTVGLIPGRNAFLVMAALLEAQDSVTGIALGIHAGTAYPDCAPAFVAASQDLAQSFARPHVAVLAPFVDWNKAEVWAYARQAGVPLDQTYSCEDRDGPCGTCLSCGDRRELHAVA